MKDDKALELFQKILEKSRDYAIQWEPTAEADYFIAAIAPEIQLKIYPYTAFDDDGPQGPVSITLNDGKGVLLVDMTYKVDGISTAELEELSYLAKRAALKLDKKMDAAIKKLNELKGNSDISF
jgi:hypothetical protein